MQELVGLFISAQQFNKQVLCKPIFVSVGWGAQSITVKGCHDLDKHWSTKIENFSFKHL